MQKSIIKNMSVHIDHEKRRIHLTHWGDITKENAVLSSIMVHSTEGFDPTYDTLVDYSAINEVDIAYADFLGTIKELNKIERRNGKIALVNGANDRGRYYLAVLFTEMANIFKSRCTYKAFQTIKDAESWLDS